MGCGGSKDAVATGNTTANGAGRGTKLFRRKSTMTASHRSSQASSSSSDGTSVAIKDVVKEPATGEPKVADVEVASDEKSVAAVVDQKKEEEVVVVEKDIADENVAAAAVAEEAAVMETAQPPAKEEDELPKSTMAVEAPVVDDAKVDEVKEAVVLKEETKAEETKAEEVSPASTNEGGESAGQSTKEPMEASTVDEHKVEDAAPVPELSSSQKNTAGATAVAPSDSTAN